MVSNFKGKKHSEKSKEILRLKALKQFSNGMPLETRQKISKSMKGKNKTKVTKLKISISKKGCKNPMFGKTTSFKQKESLKKVETRRKMRESRINHILNTYGQFFPCIGKYEKNILDCLETFLNYSILRQYKIGGYFLDGYCPALNLAIEIDEPYHLKNINNDNYREEQIKNYLNCNFLRVPIKDGVE